MASLNLLQPTYANWKAERTALAGTTYYMKSDFHYTGILVKQVSGIVDVFLVELTRTPEDTNAADFKTNIVPTAILVVSLDDAVTKAIA